MRIILAGTALLLLATFGSAAEKLTLADAVKVISAIQADKAKLAVHCETRVLFKQAGDEMMSNNMAAAVRTGKKADKIVESLGADYTALVKGSKVHQSEDVAKIETELLKLDAACK